jgi:hypothetical protein
MYFVNLVSFKLFHIFYTTLRIPRINMILINLEHYTFVLSFQCSETCGTGTQTRKVHCSLGIDRENACERSIKPEASRACLSDKDCSGLWFAGPWSQVRFYYLTIKFLLL